MSEQHHPPAGIECRVYRATRRAETYVYVRAADGVDSLPEGLRRITGRLELAMELTLTPDRRLARVEIADVLQALAEKGWFLQMPPPEWPR